MGDQPKEKIDVKEVDLEMFNEVEFLAPPNRLRFNTMNGA